MVSPNCPSSILLGWKPGNQLRGQSQSVPTLLLVSGSLAVSVLLSGCARARCINDPTTPSMKITVSGQSSAEAYVQACDDTGCTSKPGSPSGSKNLQMFHNGGDTWTLAFLQSKPKTVSLKVVEGDATGKVQQVPLRFTTQTSSCGAGPTTASAVAIAAN